MEQQADNAQLLVIGMQHAWDNLVEAREQLSLAELSIVQAAEDLRINRDHYNAGINKMSDLLEAQLLYQQACDKRTDAFADYQNKVIAYRQAVGL
jgi:outer membrane protein TolC